MRSEDNFFERLQSMKNVNNTSNSWTEKSTALDFKMKCVEHVDSLKSKKWGNKKIKTVFPELNPYLSNTEGDDSDDYDGSG
jgi:hypothetical protein